MEVDKLLEWLNKIGVQGAKEANGNIRALCPYHAERNPSWGISTSEPHAFGCFGCGAKGVLYHLLVQVGGYSPAKAKKICLIHESELNLPRFTAKEEQYGNDLVDRTLLYPFILRKPARKYLAKRGISPAAAKAARIVYDQIQNRILFPWYQGRNLVGVTARSLDRRIAQDLKSEPIWGTLKKAIIYVPARKIKKGRLVLVEGEIDAMCVYSDGEENVAAIGRGTFSRAQAQVVIESSCDEVCIFTDDDETGRQLAQSIQDMIGFTKVVSRVNYARFRGQYKAKKLDPAELTSEDRILALNRVERNVNWKNF